jgi:transcriptional regulator with XRE-family HTH domain
MMGYTIARLARESQVSESSIRRAEQGFGLPSVTLDLLGRLHQFFEKEGFSFTWEDEVPGIHWAGYPGASRGATEADPAGPF